MKNALPILNGQVIKRRLFLKEIAMSLIRSQAVKRSSIVSLPRTLRASVAKVARIDTPPQQPQPARNDGSRVRCSVCPRNMDKKTKYRCDKRKRALCISHLKYVCESCLSKKHNNDDDYDEV